MGEKEGIKWEEESEKNCAEGKEEGQASSWGRGKFLGEESLRG